MCNLLRHTYLLPLLLALSLSGSIFIVLGTPTSYAQEPHSAFKSLPADREKILNDTARAQLSDDISRGRVLRVKHAQLDINRFITDDVLVFNLFPDVSLNIQNKLRRETHLGFTDWAGQVMGHHPTMGRAFFTLKDGKAYGTIHSGRRVFEIRSNPQDTYRITEFDITKFPDEGGGPRPPTHRPHPGINPLEEATTLSDGGEFFPCLIDIMVLYTTRAITAAGSESNLLQQINTAVDSVNTMFANSGIAHQLNLIHTEGVTYNEMNKDTHDDILLGDLQNPPPGSPLSFVQGRRNSKGADIVSLWIDYKSYQYCGYARDMPPLSIGPDLDESNAYNLVEVKCAVMNHSLAHEVGHNMGAYHDRASDGLSDTDDIDTDNRGNCNQNLSQGTIMAKKSGCGENLFARQPFWSTPTLKYIDFAPMGYLKGNPGSANNSRFINQDTGHLVAKFRGRGCVPPPDDSPPVAPTGLTIR